MGSVQSGLEFGLGLGFEGTRLDELYELRGDDVGGLLQPVERLAPHLGLGLGLGLRLGFGLG